MKYAFLYFAFGNVYFILAFTAIPICSVTAVKNLNKDYLVPNYLLSLVFKNVVEPRPDLHDGTLSITKPLYNQFVGKSPKTVPTSAVG